VSRYHKGKTNLDFTEARDSECQWHQLGHMQVCTSLHTDNHTSPTTQSCRPTNSIKALKAVFFGQRNELQIYHRNFLLMHNCKDLSFGLQCFDAVGWAAGRASGL